MNDFIISVPSAPLTAVPALDAGLCDEVLYGTRITILEACKNGFSKVLTEYRYEGFVQDGSFRQTTEADKPDMRRVVIAPCADILPEPDIKRRPLLSLFRGSYVATGESLNDGWSKVALHNGAEGYIREKQVDVEKTHAKSADLRQAVIEAAFSYHGTAYRWGGRTPLGIDCSGLAHMAYLLNGVTIYRDSSIDESIAKGFPVKKISFLAAKPGDLLYFPGHIAIYLGEGQFIHSSHSNDGVFVNSLNENAQNFRPDLKQTLICAGTVFG